MMKFSSQLPIEQSRRFHIDYPEILLIAAVVVAAKLCFPLGRHSPLLQVTSTEHNIRFNWTKWHKGVQELIDASKAPGKEPSFDEVTTDQVASMTTEELDRYFAHIASTIDRKSELLRYMDFNMLTANRRLSYHKILSIRDCSPSRDSSRREQRKRQ